jgi:pyruvate/2-oxoglutarate dehydrogenase complex dihydrolipoamide acyltransferase (E2) component
VVAAGRRCEPVGDFRMPGLGADMEHGKLVEWLVKPGDYVHRGDVVAVVDTEKTVLDVESVEEGVVAELLVDVGANVPVGTALARIAQTSDDGAVQSGPQGRRHAEPMGSGTAAPEDTVPLSGSQQRIAGLRRAVGSLMSRSKKSIPHYYLSTTLDLRAALAWMQLVNEQRPVSSRLVPSALLLKAAAVAARDVPEINGFFTDGVFRPSPAVHLGVAVALRQGGMVAPAIHDADTMPVDVLMQKLRDLVSRARAGRLQRAEVADPTITVTNLGDLGVESVYGVIYPPQVAMVGLGRVVEQPWAQDGMLGVRPAVTATLSADHRVSDGLRGGRFLSRMDELLQKPEEL